MFPFQSEMCRYLLIAGLLISQGGCQLWRRTGTSSAATLASRQYVQQAVDSLEGDNRAEATRKLAMAVRANPENCEARAMYADMLWNAGNTETAVLQMQLATQHKEATAEMFVRLARMYAETGEYALAQKALSQGTQRDTTLADGWVLQGEIHLQQQHPEQAISAFHQAIFHDPECTRASWKLADAYLAMGNPQRALEITQYARSKNTTAENIPELLYREGLAMNQLQRYSDATEVLAQAAGKTSPENTAEQSHVLAALAFAQYHAGQHADALATARKTLEITPQDPCCQDIVQQLHTPEPPPRSLPAEVQPQYGNQSIVP